MDLRWGGESGVSRASPNPGRAGLALTLPGDGSLLLFDLPSELPAVRQREMILGAPATGDRMGTLPLAVPARIHGLGR